MKTPLESNDEFTDKSLQAWRVTATLPPRFQERVWRKIEMEPASNQAGLWTVLQYLAGRFLARRAWAVSYLVVALVAGVGSGYWRARESSTAMEEGLGQRYVQSIDPYQKPER